MSAEETTGYMDELFGVDWELPGTEAVIHVQKIKTGEGFTLTPIEGSKAVELSITNRGDKGDKGDPGSQGVQGEPGIQGQKGDQGDRGLPGVVSVELHTTPGTYTWTKPPGTAAVEVTLVPGGGKGGNGGNASGNSSGGGGSGGGSGWPLRFMLRGNDIPESVSYTVPAAGAAAVFGSFTAPPGVTGGDGTAGISGGAGSGGICPAGRGGGGGGGGAGEAGAGTSSGGAGGVSSLGVSGTGGNNQGQSPASGTGGALWTATVAPQTVRGKGGPASTGYGAGGPGGGGGASGTYAGSGGVGAPGANGYVLPDGTGPSTGAGNDAVGVNGGLGKDGNSGLVQIIVWGG